MATCGAYKFKVERTAILKNGLTVGENGSSPVKSTGHFSFKLVLTSTTAPQTMRLRLFYGNTEYKRATKAVVQAEADLFLIWIYAKKYANIFLK